jgi:uncharacterized membrane protein
VLSGIKVLDDRFANPAYALLLVTGLVMVWVGDLELTQFWLAGGLTLYLVAIVLGLFVYTPTLRHRSRRSKPGMRRSCSVCPLAGPRSGSRSPWTWSSSSS